MENKIAILLDNGHGCNTPGKRSPVLPGGGRLLEYMFTRALVGAIETEAKSAGFLVERIVPELVDVSLTTRGRRANAYIKAHPDTKCVLFSIHGNAAGNGGWCSARGFEAWTTTENNNSDRLAACLYDAVARELPGVPLRGAKTAGKEKNFTIIAAANCPAVLTENLFYDNREDVALMLDASTLQALARAHVQAVANYFGV